MAINLGSAYGKVTIDASGVKSGVSTATASLQDLSKLGMSIGREMQNIGRAMTIGISLPLIGIGAASIKAASDLNDARGKMRLVFGEMSDDVLAWSKTSADAFGQSQRKALEGVADFGLLFTQIGLTTGKAAQMSQSMVQLASDIAVFKGIDPSAVFELLKSGLVGRGMELKKFGIALSDATVKAKAMEMGLQDANGDLSEGALVQARYALIMEGTTKMQGFFAKSQGDVSVQTTIMKAKLENSAAMLGERLIPIVLRVVETLNRLLDLFLKLPTSVQDGILVLGGLLILMGPVIGFIGSIVSLVSAVIGAIGLLGTAGISLATIVGVVGSIAAVLATVVFPILLIIGTLGLLYLAFRNNFGGIRTTAEQLWTILKWGFSTMWRNLVTWAQEGMFNIGEAMRSGAERIRIDLSGLTNWMETAWRNTMDWMARMAAWGRNAIFTVFRVDWAALGRSIINGIINGFLSGLASLVEAARKAAQAALDQIKKTLGIKSPSMEAFKLGMMTGEGFSLGMARGIDPRAIARMVARPVQQMSTSQQQNLSMHFGSGLTVQQAQSLIAQSKEEILEDLSVILGIA